VLNGFGEDDLSIIQPCVESDVGGPSASVWLGSSTSFLEVGRQVAQSLTLNYRQAVALRVLCRHLDWLHSGERSTPQLCQFVGGEGGTGKSRVIEAIIALFASKGMLHHVASLYEEWYTLFVLVVKASGKMLGITNSLPRNVPAVGPGPKRIRNGSIGAKRRKKCYDRAYRKYGPKISSTANMCFPQEYGLTAINIFEVYCSDEAILPELCRLYERISWQARIKKEYGSPAHKPEKMVQMRKLAITKSHT
jgi:hypothetical protein